MARRVALVLALALGAGSCSFARKHPGITTGVVAGSIGFTSCWIAVEKLGTCSAIGGGVGIALGGITGLVTTFADTSAHELPPDPEEQPFVRQVVRPDAGVDPATSVDAGVPDAAPIDAGAP